MYLLTNSKYYSGRKKQRTSEKKTTGNGFEFTLSLNLLCCKYLFSFFVFQRCYSITNNTKKRTKIKLLVVSENAQIVTKLQIYTCIFKIIWIKKIKHPSVCSLFTLAWIKHIFRGDDYIGLMGFQCLFHINFTMENLSCFIYQGGLNSPYTKLEPRTRPILNR